MSEFAAWVFASIGLVLAILGPLARSGMAKAIIETVMRWENKR